MSLVLNLTPEEEARVADIAAQNGLAPEAWTEKLVREQLPDTEPMAEMRRRLREWQQQDTLPMAALEAAGDSLAPTSALFEQWAREDATLTGVERASAERLWLEYREGIDAERRASGMRTLF